MFRALQERPEALNVLLGAHCIVSEAILKAFWSPGPAMVANGRLQPASAASGQPLVSADNAIFFAFSVVYGGAGDHMVRLELF